MRYAIKHFGNLIFLGSLILSVGEYRNRSVGVVFHAVNRSNPESLKDVPPEDLGLTIAGQR